MDIWEDNPGYKLTATSVTIAYNIVGAGAMDKNAVKAALLAFAPLSNAPPGSTYAWPRRGMTLDEVEASSGIWKATITWAVLKYQYALEIGGSQQQVRCSKSVIGLYTDANQKAEPPGNVGEKGIAIGWDGRTVHGTSIYIPTRTWTESVEIPAGQYSFDYEDAVNSINVSPVNKNEFRGFAPGDVLFQGMTSQFNVENPDFVLATFKFSQSQGNRKNGLLPLLTIGNIQGIEKDGWDWLDVFFIPAVGVQGKGVVPTPAYVMIHRVFDRSDFAGLKIGTDENLPLWQG